MDWASKSQAPLRYHRHAFGKTLRGCWRRGKKSHHRHSVSAIAMSSITTTQLLINRETVMGYKPTNPDL